MNTLTNGIYRSGFYDTNLNAHNEGQTIVSERDQTDDKTLVSVFQWFVEKTQS